MEIHDHCRINSRGLKLGFEGRNPRRAVCNCLIGVGEVPMWCEGDVPRNMLEMITAGITRHMLQSRGGVPASELEEDAHLLLAVWRCVHPGIDIRVVVGRLLNAETDLSPP